MTTDTREFMGIPIEGEPTYNRSHHDQRTREELEPLVQALLRDEGIAEFGWSQYTPYFNDGDVCEFGVCDLWVRTIWDDEDADRDELYVYDSHPTLGKSPYRVVQVPTGEKDWYGRERYKHEYEHYENEHYNAERYQVAEALSSAINSGEFESLLYDLFGDHANVIVTRDGITIDFYDHD